MNPIDFDVNPISKYHSPTVMGYSLQSPVAEFTHDFLLNLNLLTMFFESLLV